MLDFSSTLVSKAFKVPTLSDILRLLNEQVTVSTRYKHYGMEWEEHSSRSLPCSLGQRDSQASTQGLGAGLECLHTPPKTVQSRSGQQRERKVQD